MHKKILIFSQKYRTKNGHHCTRTRVAHSSNSYKVKALPTKKGAILCSCGIGSGQRINIMVVSAV